jgi:hypothetical protein
MAFRSVGSGGLVLLAAVLVACGGGNGSTTPTQGPPVIVTPTPAPTAIPTPAAIACGQPTPPPLYGFRLKVGNDLGYKKVLDSRPLVGRDVSYCGALGLPGDICVVRDEHADDAVTCGNLVAGLASQTGRYGPNWFWNDKPCRGIGEGGDEPGCRQHPENQWFVFTFGPGTYSACGDRDRICHGIEIE